MHYLRGARDFDNEASGEMILCFCSKPQEKILPMRERMHR